MAKHTQTICRLLPENYLNVFDHFVGLALKGLNHRLVLYNNLKYVSADLKIPLYSKNFAFLILRILE